MASNQTTTNLNNMEKEVILLKASIGMINDMVNAETIEVRGNNGESIIYFVSTIHMNYFYIILVDFLCKPDSKFFNIQNSYLDELLNICTNPSFDQNNSIATFKQITQEFKSWLESEVIIPHMWLPSIDLEIDFKLKRIDFITICGNIYKHNFTRLTHQAKKVKQLFENNEKTLSEEESLLILEDFHSKFNEDVLLYHNSTIVEFLNNIRWGIQDYLWPQYSSSCKPFYDERLNINGYKYEYPINVINDLAKNYYWQLMNDIRQKPYIPKFIIWNNLKKYY